MQFYFIRHGQSENNALWEATGSEKGRSHDPELTQIGHEQAECLAEFIAAGSRRGGNFCGESPNGDAFELTHLYCSLMVRAVATASAVSQKVGLPLTAWDCIHECGGIFLEDEETGELSGLPGYGRSYFAEKYPHLVVPETLGEEGWWNRPFEDDDLRLPRAQQFLTDLLERHGDTRDRVAIVSHAGFYNEFLTAVLGLPARLEKRWFSLHNTGITRIDFVDGETRLVYLNRTTHLPPNLLT